MTIEEFQVKLNGLLKGFPVSGFDAVQENVVEELNGLSEEADKLGMNSGKKLVSNLADAIKARKSGKNSDESVQVRLVALDFYLKNLQSGSTEDL